jgi:hypothetical protein
MGDPAAGSSKRQPNPRMKPLGWPAASRFTWPRFAGAFIAHLTSLKDG